ncbi:hypothetical protein DRE_01577 [Drechslerella stenobrocha 248]|uniref:F-box domain-containing protein n=1 Tax=Drechslerella stenobrocha 248 TaxID=1043628 RepID=W7I4M4_9PEZI|nr:hypothetical protein DRE_01577 [Drechslerella stenobrocha 248]
MDGLPPEILLQVFKHFDAYTVLTILRPVCKAFSYACAIHIPSLKLAGLPPALWEKVFSHLRSYKTLHSLSACDSSFYSLIRSTRLPQLQVITFRLPLGSTSPPVAGLPPQKVAEHPAFENICCRIELGSLIYHKTGISCPTDLLTFPVANDNATNPPVDKLLVRFSARYGITLRPVLITKRKGAKNAGEPGEQPGGVTVGDVYSAMRRLFVEPLTEKQIKALRDMRDWEARKHEAVKQAVSRIEQEAAAAEGTAASSGETLASTSNNMVEPTASEKEPEEPEEPVIEHDESEICFEQPIAAEYTSHPGDKIQRQREFLSDFPYVYASAHLGANVNGTQVFVLTYH